MLAASVYLGGICIINRKSKIVWTDIFHLIFPHINNISANQETNQETVSLDGTWQESGRQLHVFYGPQLSE